MRLSPKDIATIMLHPRIIEGRPFDWQTAEQEVNARLGPNGEMTFGAAMCADPGVLSCPFCGSYMWHEGRVVECPVCEQRFLTDWRALARKATGRDPVSVRISNETNANIVRILHDAWERDREGFPFELPRDAPPIIRDFVRIVRDARP